MKTGVLGKGDRLAMVYPGPRSFAHPQVAPIYIASFVGVCHKESEHFARFLYDLYSFIRNPIVIVCKNPHPKGWGYTNEARLRGLKDQGPMTHDK
ncbi:hypothetical protein [Oscillatoria acuminata]|uniref:Uncharacterized protein n=1 Tax=Oscillatoria acuminata PCC 6304 TaxID=56110 RepID=K9TS37_9CYAN|nr:hypothetical protein [Oscillatoria acuminata]AFY85228.1 hypothetical protein Oscil6304_5755 [Oscillatoria acuminata PCC 6304]